MSSFETPAVAAAEPSTRLGRPAVDATVVAHLAHVAAQRPDALAVVTPDESITYRHLVDTAVERGRAVAAAEPDQTRPIAVDMAADPASVIRLFSVLHAARPVILLDPHLPDERRAHILEGSAARYLSVDEFEALAPSNEPVDPPTPDDVAIIVYTSGSTGRPKGVAHRHRTYVCQGADGHEILGIGPDDRTGVLLSLSFGGGIDAQMMSLLTGATMLLWDVRSRSADGLHPWLAEQRATTVHATPSLLRSWLGGARSEAAPIVRLLTACGEPVHHTDVELARATVLGDGDFGCWLGSSETANLAFALFRDGELPPPGPVPAGVPAPGHHVRIVDDDGADVAPGTVGAVVIESMRIAPGYWRADAAVAARFTDLDDGRTRLQTGDLGRIDDRGWLHIVGRSDDAVKVRGYLVEPSEVENAVRSLTWVVDAAVVGDREAGTLTAYAAVADEGWTPSPGEVRTELARLLPVWMVPRDVVIMTEIPRNERGKVDRSALPTVPTRVVEPPAGPTEQAIAHIWSQALGLDEVGRSEDFLSLGGDSLAAARMLAALSERWLVDITSVEFAQSPTVAALAELVDSAHRSREAATDIVRLRDGDGRAVFIAAGAGSPAAALAPLVRELDVDGPVYGLQAHGLERRGRADRSIRAAARRAVRDIRSVQPRGPYLLVGYSFGGFVVLEAAAQLAADGVEATVTLIDPLFEPELATRLGAPRASCGATRIPPVRETRDHESPTTVSERLREVYSRIALRGLVATAGLWRLPTTLQWTIFWDLGRVLIRRHRPARYPGRVTVIIADDNHDDPALWSRIVTGAVDIVHVRGDHHSMMRSPLAAATAAAVSGTLSRFEELSS